MHRAHVVAKPKAKSEIVRKAGQRIVPIELSLFGSSDGVPVELTGRGKSGAETGKLSLEVRSARSFLLFDPALVGISLLDVLALASLDMFPTPEADDDSSIYLRTRADLYDENGRDAGNWRIVAVLERVDDGLRLLGQLLECHQHIEPGERVTAVEAPWAVMAQALEPEGALLAGVWGARTQRGGGYRGVTTTVISQATLPPSALGASRLELGPVEVGRTAAVAYDVVSFTAQLAQ